ncbi:MAG: M14 family metallopeptidase, partial [Planctomycetota bacterium]
MTRTRLPGIAAAAAAATFLLAMRPAGAEPPPHLDGYRDHRGLTQAVHAIADADPAARLDLIGSSRDGRGLYLFTLSSDLEQAGARPALLIVAGLDARHLVGTETAVRVAAQLLAEHDDLLDEFTIYVIPRVNPDGAERIFEDVLIGVSGTTTPVDVDRDGFVDEDGPVDLNGDGVITMMRRPDPPLDDEATHMADPLEPRLLKEPDAAKGERATYAVYVEGLDQDADGQIAEDGPGTVDLDRNFMHLWSESRPDAGTHQLSESESLALAQFVLDHPNIVAAITYGRHDNLVNVPAGKGKDITGRGPKDLDGDDVAYYKKIAEQFTELTDQTRAPEVEIDGSFHAWLYAQRGIPSFATVVWGRPDLPEPEAEEVDADEEAGEAPEPAAAEPEDEPAPDPVTGTWSGSVNLPELGTELAFTIDLERSADDSVSGTFGSAMFTGSVTGRYDAASGQLTLVTEGGEETSASFVFAVEQDAITGSVTTPQGERIN